MTDIARPATPRSQAHSRLDLTPEQVKQIELNRLRAKQRQREQEESSSSSTRTNLNHKRPLDVVPANSTSPTAPGASKSRPLKRDSRLGKYFDYDLSKMANSKGGFLIEDDKEVDEDMRAKEKQRERERAMQNLDPPIFLERSKNPACQECGSIDIDQTYRKVLRCLVCNKCKNDKPEKYSLLTKTECKEDYLLTDAELRDEDVMPHILKANPHKSTYANMMLFLRCQVEDFAWKKWGSPEALDAEWERRTAEKKKKKNKKFEESLKDLRRRTREGVWQKRRDEEHKHVFSGVERREAGRSVQMAEPHNLSDQRDIASSLHVEQLDTSLFRSTSLWTPYRARGVFGGQVISQATVAATQCVSAEYALHCYFLLSASTTVPILYYVERLREGRSYVTRSVKAVQNGKVIFMLLCSFQRPEPWQPSHQWPMPPNVPSPVACELEEDRMWSKVTQERERSPVAIKLADVRTQGDGTKIYMYWMRAKNIPTHEAPFQKCILGYISDFHFIGVASSTLGLKRFSKGPDAVSMMVRITLDHFDCGEWLLYVIASPRTGSGRGVSFGRMYTQGGKLIAVMSQEGVVRADVRKPDGKDSALAKL
ncbi:hypothetical protein PUNSTDRAFT_109805 [Punctularia strigosozonata HHB-11173 SS5]|uniref:uncharacterized protein n=1 Tax=Punctularia strigosozonata (strain HHB-11173) TaxID=741275 RepID=UPI0004417793|nr:uncharacterized protein PUNSTDRAFT_109805 [Punctularia strigosozonata HHB-11173 SS5]EIN13614.1 hypothetical protein PUNSTDRAFT_109805 [Punctularia strigosozonata HHB-11173 SS5]